MVLASEPGGWDRDDTACGAELHTGPDYQVARSLVRKGLGDIVIDGAGYPRGLYFNNSALGLALRQHILDTTP